MFDGVGEATGIGRGTAQRNKGAQGWRGSALTGVVVPGARSGQKSARGWRRNGVELGRPIAIPGGRRDRDERRGQTHDDQQTRQWSNVEPCRHRWFLLD